MNTSSTISQHQKMMSMVPAACLSFLTLGSLSVYGPPENFLLTLSGLAVFISLILIVAFVRAKP